MSGLLAALALTNAAAGTCRVYERVAEPLAGRGAGIVAQPELKAVLRALGLDAGPRSRHRSADAGHVRARRPRDAPRADRADHDGMGPRVSLAESRVARGELSPRQGTAPRRAGRAASWRISPTARPRRAMFWSAPTASARPCASNISPRSRRSMRATRRGAGWWPKQRFRRRCTRTCSRISRSACRQRADARLSGGGAGQRSAARAPALQFRLVPAGERGTRIAAAADRRFRAARMRSRSRRR